ncbi:MAG: large conductance mechanosensitive channel protein MscL [Lachnospiraceae bacterium]
MKKFFEEFKEFISKGDVMSMAVGIIVGGAFTAIVTALTQNIITPLLGVIMGGIDFSGIAFTIGEEEIAIGLFIQAVINFLITAFVLFVILKIFNNFKRKEETPTPAPAPTVPEDIQLLAEIRDLLKDQK